MKAKNWMVAGAALILATGVCLLLNSLAPEIGLCENFLDEHGREDEITVVVALITVKDREGDLSIGWACNHGRECHRRSCIYARASE